VTAGACDYLVGVLEPDDVVHVLPLSSNGGDRRPESGPGSGESRSARDAADAADAVNVARSRLAASGATVSVRRGVEAAGPDEALRDAVDATDADEVVVGDRRDGAGEPDDDPDARLLALVRASAVPVRVVPAPP
jgi:hypothetical protein